QQPGLVKPMKRSRQRRGERGTTRIISGRVRKSQKPRKASGARERPGDDLTGAFTCPARRFVRSLKWTDSPTIIGSKRPLPRRLAFRGFLMRGECPMNAPRTRRLRHFLPVAAGLMGLLFAFRPNGPSAAPVNAGDAP